MKKKLNLFASVILIVCISLTVFASCQKDEAKSTTTTTKAESSATTAQAVTVTEQSPVSEGATEVITYNDENGYTIYSYVDVTNVPNNAPVAGPEVNPATAAGTTASASTPSTVPAPATSTAAAPENTTINPDEFPTLPEISNGIILVRTKYASRGDLVSVSVVMANPNSEYTIEFYETDTRVSDSAGLEPKIASSNGTVEWRFTLDYDCQIGTRKLIIREKGTDNYAQTYIIVNG